MFFFELKLVVTSLIIIAEKYILTKPTVNIIIALVITYIKEKKNREAKIMSPIIEQITIIINNGKAYLMMISFLVSVSFAIIIHSPFGLIIKFFTRLKTNLKFIVIVVLN